MDEGRTLRVLRSRDNARCQNGEKLIGLKKTKPKNVYGSAQVIVIVVDTLSELSIFFSPGSCFFSSPHPNLEERPPGPPPNPRQSMSQYSWTLQALNACSCQRNAMWAFGFLSLVTWLCINYNNAYYPFRSVFERFQEHGGSGGPGVFWGDDILGILLLPGDRGTE